MNIEAFQHAVAANDIECAVYLVDEKYILVQFPGSMAPVISWLASLPASVLDARPHLWVMYATALTIAGRLTIVEPKLQSDEKILENLEENEITQDPGCVCADPQVVRVQIFQGPAGLLNDDFHMI